MNRKALASTKRHRPHAELSPVQTVFWRNVDAVCFTRERKRASLETALSLMKESVGELEAFLWPKAA